MKKVLLHVLTLGLAIFFLVMASSYDYIDIKCGDASNIMLEPVDLSVITTNITIEVVDKESNDAISNIELDVYTKRVFCIPLHMSEDCPNEGTVRSVVSSSDIYETNGDGIVTLSRNWDVGDKKDLLIVNVRIQGNGVYSAARRRIRINQDQENIVMTVPLLKMTAL
ncbi:MAG TPA: hypothetical protein VJ917_10580 [Saprospiraceae bacterium]|nr:hypothetical protein [Saprospiraceae bacterium]